MILSGQERMWSKLICLELLTLNKKEKVLKFYTMTLAFYDLHVNELLKFYFDLNYISHFAISSNRPTHLW